MPISVEQSRGELETLLADTPGELSLPLKFGLGAGLYFEYFRRPNDSPSRRISGLNRNLLTALRTRLPRYQTGDPVQVLRDALRENALLFNLDRAPTTALMGIEMLAEQLADFAAVSDWQACVAAMRNELIRTGMLYRKTYLEFLQEINLVMDTHVLSNELTEIITEWSAFADLLAEAHNDPIHLERSGRALRRLAFREEHYWGNVLHLASNE